MRTLLLFVISIGCEPGSELTTPWIEEAESAETHCDDGTALTAWQNAADGLRLEATGAPERRRTLRSLADSYSANGRYVEAHAALDEAEGLTPPGWDEERLRLALSRARLELDEWHLDEGERLLGEIRSPERSQAVARMPKAFRNQLLFAENTLYRMRGRFDQVEETMAPLLSESPALAANALNRLAMSLSAQGRNQEAQETLERALALADTTDTSSCRNAETQFSLIHNLALAFDDQGRPADAAPLFELVLEDDQAHLGPEHPGTANTMYNLAIAKSDLGDKAGALALYERALAIQEAAYGPQSARLIPTLNELGRAAWEGFDDVEAERLWLRAAAIFEAGDKTTFGMTTQVWLAKLYHEHHEPTLEAHYLGRALAFAELNPREAENAREMLAQLRE
jgi:tetratricopeptide (TPR) repeat protein